MDNVTVDELRSLALMYVEHQGLVGLSPEQLFDKYAEAYDRICAHCKKQHERKMAK